MSEILTMEEVEKKFDGEWVLIEDVETNEQLEVLRGKVTYHGNDKNELHRRAMKSKTKHFASLFIGKPDPKMEFLLGFENAQTTKKFRFKADYGLVYVRVKVSCADREIILNLALDTGASGTIVSAKKLIEVGYDLDKPEDETYITTGSGLIFVPKFTIEKLTALGKEKTNFQIIAHDFPPTSSVDGVLGLDFLPENV